MHGQGVGGVVEREGRDREIGQGAGERRGRRGGGGQSPYTPPTECTT